MPIFTYKRYKDLPTTHPTVTMQDCKIDDTVKLSLFINLYGCEIGENSLVGPFVEIQKDVKIGKNTRIQSHSFICSLVEIGDNCRISHGVMFINDVFRDGKPANNDESKWEKTIIEDNVFIGSNATILPVMIGHDSIIGAGAVVTKDVEPYSVMIGNPAKLLKTLPEYCKINLREE